MHSPLRLQKNVYIPFPNVFQQKNDASEKYILVFVSFFPSHTKKEKKVCFSLYSPTLQFTLFCFHKFKIQAQPKRQKTISQQRPFCGVQKWKKANHLKGDFKSQDTRMHSKYFIKGYGKKEISSKRNNQTPLILQELTIKTPRERHKKKTYS